MLESEIQRDIIKFLKAKGAYVEKVIAASKSGVPDLYGCYKGMFFYIEVKTPKTRDNVSDLQKIKIKSAIRAGGKAIVAWTIEQVADLLKEIDNDTQRTSK